ncbi:hypothetical protein DL96DRAFT_1423221, partial [Flagelloscypha sp. PMI_526]
FTAHKSQGMTLENAVVDLVGCKGTSMPYVMVSQVTSLAGLRVLWPFDIKKIQCPLNLDQQAEQLRMSILREKT